MNVTKFFFKFSILGKNTRLSQKVAFILDSYASDNLSGLEAVYLCSKLIENTMKVTLKPML